MEGWRYKGLPRRSSGSSSPWASKYGDCTTMVRGPRSATTLVLLRLSISVEPEHASAACSVPPPRPFTHPVHQLQRSWPVARHKKGWSGCCLQCVHTFPAKKSSRSWNRGGKAMREGGPGKGHRREEQLLLLVLPMACCPESIAAVGTSGSGAGGCGGGGAADGSGCEQACKAQGRCPHQRCKRTVESSLSSGTSGADVLSLAGGAPTAVRPRLSASPSPPTPMEAHSWSARQWADSSCRGCCCCGGCCWWWCSEAYACSRPSSG
mmetsp:Transcript_11929/g.32610  ORF Transcript_11929/g.32610 Transcript_11929/m.32610 type:complete len:265 (+) Transcript_11929:279-1073(+)